MAKLSVKLGDRAPDFEALDDRGSSVRLSDFRKKNRVLLYFYPRDKTPGCTIEARSFNESLFEFERRKTVVFGVSTDDVRSHGRFRDSCALRFRLIADPDKRVCRAYGAIGGLPGLLGIASRVTVLLDEYGIVRAVWNKVSPRSHPEDVLRELDRLGLA